ncbi:MAG TPA: glycosyltransferase family 4 protein [Dehalococcoidia bacterium]|nr:glycosyltransferase family 4 protein [Dehalococcoidia bacterium]
MKICLVSPYDFAVPGGVGNHITQIAEQYANLGHDVVISAPSSRRDIDLPFARFLPIGTPVGVPAGGSVARIAISLSGATDVRAALQREEFDVVHVHEPMMPALPYHFLRYYDGPRIGTFHAAQEGGNLMYRFTTGLMNRWFSKLDGKIAVSPAAARLISRYFPGDYEVIPNGIDTKRFHPQVPPIESLQDGKTNILFLGRPEKRKGLRFLLRAFAQVRAETSTVRLIVVGRDSKLMQSHREWVQRTGLADVVFTGYVPDEEVPRYYRTADIYCAPNIGNESFGLVLVEAMACGTPIVASNIEGFADVVTHGVHGLLTTPEDENAIAAALLQLIKSPALREQMARQGLGRAQEFGWERIGSRIISYYDRIAREKAAAPSPQVEPREAPV